MSSTVVDAYWAAPPIARTASTITFVIGVLYRAKLVNRFWLFHSLDMLNVFKTFPPQIWRPVTCFLVDGGNIKLLFDTYFLYHYMSQLEVGHPRFPRKADLAWYLICVGTFILTIDHLVGFHFGFYIRALILSMCYTVTQDQRGMKVNYFFLTIPAQYMPLCMIFVSLLMPGGYYDALLELEGLVAAHLFDFLNRIWPEFGGGPRILATPEWLVKIVRTPRFIERGFGTAIRPNEPASGSSSGVSRGLLPDSWRTRGSGHRLG